MDELSDPDTALYNMIIGTDLLIELVIDLRFGNQTMLWEDMTVPLHRTGKNQDQDDMIYILATKAPILN